MSKSPFGAAITGAGAAVDASSPHAVTMPRQDLADLAAMLLRVEALVAADVTPEPTGSDSIERIADIAFVLHERDVEASLCDALDAAVREISAASAQKEDRARRARQAAEMLRELAQRINGMIALSEAQHSEPPGKAKRIEEPLSPPVASRGGSLPLPGPAVAPASNPQRETGTVAVSPSAPVQKNKSLGGQAAAAADLPKSTVQSQPSVAAVVRSVKPASDAFLDDDLLLPPTANEAAVSNKPTMNAVVSSEAPPPSPGHRASVPLNPEDDPGDLFEPAAGTPPEPEIGSAALLPALRNGHAPVSVGAVARPARPEDNAPAPLAAAPASFEADSTVKSSNPPLRFTAPMPPSVPHPEPTDPLAPIRALSEEETIALFS